MKYSKYFMGVNVLRKQCWVNVVEINKKRTFVITCNGENNLFQSWWDIKYIHALMQKWQYFWSIRMIIQYFKVKCCDSELKLTGAVCSVKWRVLSSLKSHRIYLKRAYRLLWFFPPMFTFNTYCITNISETQMALSIFYASCI